MYFKKEILFMQNENDITIVLLKVNLFLNKFTSKQYIKTKYNKK